ncbi:hypothetical protein BYT27DRAFT_7200335 [Phlegmacium glaucopus]|nr:hypothetical protein BYT27DRAFT_7200335 [Phlegmacium glaucopus]
MRAQDYTLSSPYAVKCICYKSRETKESPTGFIPSEKLNKRESTEPNTTSEEKENDPTEEECIVPAANGEDVEMGDEIGDTEPKDATDPYEQHFGMKPEVLSEKSRGAVQDHSWKRQERN